MAEFITKDSGQRVEFDTGARRDIETGKGRYDLLPRSILKRDAQLYERGAAKYGDNNWKKGIPTSRFLSSAMRHLMQLANGEDDEDHGAAVRFNVAGIMFVREEIAAGRLPAELDDLQKEASE